MDEYLFHEIILKKNDLFINQIMIKYMIFLISKFAEFYNHKYLKTNRFILWEVKILIIIF